MNRYKVLGGFVLLGHAVVFALMWLQVEPFYTFFYSLAWWSFIILLSCANQSLGKNSIVFDRKQFIWVFLFSSFFWFVFEAYNFWLRNWHYIGVPIEPYLRWPGYFVAFGTVIPGILETERFFSNLKIFSPLKGPRIRVSPSLRLRFLILGFLLMIAPLISPTVFFPCVWLGLIFCLDPVVYRCGKAEESISGQAEKGEYGKLMRLLLAGFTCGFLWEFWNFWAGSKWYYTIPFFDFFKVFEMPLPGYFGFPVFAVECYLAYRLLGILRSTLFQRSRVLVVLSLLLALAFSAWVIRGIEESTVVSYKIVVPVG